MQEQEIFATFGDKFSEFDEVVKTVTVLRGETRYRIEVIKDYSRKQPRFRVNHFRRGWADVEIIDRDGSRTKERSEAWVPANFPWVSLEEPPLHST